MTAPALHIDWLTRACSAPARLAQLAAELRISKGPVRYQAANALDAAASRIDASDRLITKLQARIAALEAPTATAQVEILASTLVFPTGADPESSDYSDLHHFALNVCFRGPRQENGQGGWAVMVGESHQLSRAGNWAWPQRFQQHQYRWDTREEALAMARKHVDQRKVNGRTWAEWERHFAARAAGSEA
ncbi:hypothetical protein [Curtobacterium sp. MCBD17_040]|uniref:hypothetical protein n=1 Tax=Curtobacterium sp. MCBD17_040 TaxID=2175674 RepID=UPI000DA7F14D|nr:hypothetical protein [Curtobacterium sp. MCBD17_040]WIB65926.1 hypothetical protein DEI94_17575 [Curtobacterium sp. MCBD17_040]